MITVNAHFSLTPSYSCVTRIKVGRFRPGYDITQSSLFLLIPREVLSFSCGSNVRFGLMAANLGDPLVSLG
jgi:hypothetical protein